MSVRRALAIAALLAAGPVAAQEPSPRALEQARERQLHLSDETDRRAVELGALVRQATAAAAGAQDAEERLSDIEDRLAALDQEMTERRAGFAARRGEVAELMLALQRLGREPAAGLLVRPGGPLETARAAILLGAFVAPLAGRAAAVGNEIERAAALRELIYVERRAAAEAADVLALERIRLEELVRLREALHRERLGELREASRQVAALARASLDLGDLVARLPPAGATPRRERLSSAGVSAAAGARALGAEAAGGGAGRRIAQALGQLPPPVRGRIVRAFGQASEVGGQPHRGLTYETRPGAQVVAPFDGVVAFAGPFRGYGLILILEHGEGYHTLLSGLGRIDSAVGQWLAAGEPVGVMDLPVQDNPKLYLELRRAGQSIDPLPWLAAPKEKVTG